MYSKEWQFPQIHQANTQWHSDNVTQSQIYTSAVPILAQMFFFFFYKFHSTPTNRLTIDFTKTYGDGKSVQRDCWI